MWRDGIQATLITQRLCHLSRIVQETDLLGVSPEIPKESPVSITIILSGKEGVVSDTWKSSTGKILAMRSSQRLKLQARTYLLAITQRKTGRSVGREWKELDDRSGEKIATDEH